MCGSDDASVDCDGVWCAAMCGSDDASVDCDGV